jgi:hypothetical protein
MNMERGYDVVNYGQNMKQTIWKRHEIFPLTSRSSEEVAAGKNETSF